MFSLSSIVSPPDDDFSPSNLQKITDDLSISLFDEVVMDILRDDRQRETNVHHRIEKKWLGSLTIPFSTLHERERVRYVTMHVQWLERAPIRCFGMCKCTLLQQVLDHIIIDIIQNTVVLSFNVLLELVFFIVCRWMVPFVSMCL